jgi:hypothetical protein
MRDVPLQQKLTVSLDDFALGLSHVIDPSSVDLVTCSKERLPSSHGVGSDNWMRSGEVISLVLRRAAITINQFKVVL